MSTNGIIARATGENKFEGRYHHWDSYPSGLGKSLVNLYRGGHLVRCTQCQAVEYLGGKSAASSASNRVEERKFMYLKVKQKGKFKFVSGYVIDKYGEPKLYKGGSIIHLLQIGNGVKVVEQEMDKHYGELKDKGSRIED